mmetsp:Transcript_25107/g.54655  ORF Transcript_25107/g.54655 Transcript_25107/m.54655 type:complete len:973 (-) Transcript_25107:215-3133(-)
MDDNEDLLASVATDGGDQKKKQKKIKPGSFQGLGLGPATYKAIMRMGYNTPTPIQRKTIPTIMDGQDVVAMARTGSGKTAAFLIPVVERLKAHSVAVGFRAVALSPTRELAMQTAKFFRQLSKFTDLRCCLLLGGQAMEAQFEHLANNPDVVIATPGRLMHHILEAELSLSRVEILIFDEADRLFELGFAEQLEKILKACPLSRQCLLFSATLPSQLVSFSRAGLRDPVFVRLDVETTISDSLDLWYLYVRREEKIAAAISVLRFLSQPKKSTIMFVATRHHVEFFGELLNQLGISTAVVYGSMDQDARTEMISKFRKKKCSVLVTTDVAARGIDVPLLDYVVNYDFPPSGKLFVHRAGRTARAGQSGLAISLVTIDDLPYTVELMLFLGRKLRVPGASSEEPASGEAAADATKKESLQPMLGSLPPLEHDMEALSALLEDEGSELQAFHKSMLASYRLYNKTRPSASKQSVARAKQLMEDCGGPAQLQRLVHPAFKHLAQTAIGGTTADNDKGQVATAEQESSLIAELRGYRPRESKLGNVLSTTAMRTMEAAKLDASAVSTALKSRGGDMDSSEFLANKFVKKKGSVNEEDDLDLGAVAEDDLILGNDESDDDDEDDGKEDAKAAAQENRPVKGDSSKKGVKRKVPEVRDKVRISKRQRKKMQKGGAGGSNVDQDFDDDFDISVDGVNIAAAASQSTKKKKEPVKQFYLSVDKNQQEEAKERGLDMEEYQMDLLPDDSSDLKKSKSVIRWDAKKKKYLPVMVSADGRVQKSNRRNESGKKVTGDGVKSNIYKKWVQSTKKRIPKVGEMEQAYSKPMSRHQQQLAAKQAAADAIEFDDRGNTKKGPRDGKKPVVPFHGEVEEKYLTAKQKRMLKKRERTDRVIEGKSKREVRTPEEIQRHKKLKEKNAERQNKRSRREKGEKIREARKKRLEERQMKYGARTKAKMIIMEGHGKTKRQLRQRKTGHSWATI